MRQLSVLSLKKELLQGHQHFWSKISTNIVRISIMVEKISTLGKKQY